MALAGRERGTAGASADADGQGRASVSAEGAGASWLLALGRRTSVPSAFPSSLHLVPSSSRTQQEAGWPKSLAIVVHRVPDPASHNKQYRKVGLWLRDDG